MSRLLDHACGDLFAPPGESRWRLEGTTCTWCAKRGTTPPGTVHVVHPSDPCDRPDLATGACERCGAAKGGLCMLLAEGYASCTVCDVPTRVFPDDVVAGREAS